MGLHGNKGRTLHSYRLLVVRVWTLHFDDIRMIARPVEATHGPPLDKPSPANTPEVRYVSPNVSYSFSYIVAKPTLCYE